MSRLWIFLILLTAACGAPEPVTPGLQGTEVVEVRLTCATGDPQAPCAFRPAEVSIRVGGTVRWINDDATYHTVTASDRIDLRVPSGRFDAVLDEAAETFSHTFTEPGTYAYYCQPHAEFMAGMVKVDQ